MVVRDTGIECTEDLPLLFDPYHRFGDLGRSEGLGLGLTLVKSLVEAIAVLITAESGGLGAGSVFSFALPLSAAARRRRQPHRPRHRRGSVCSSSTIRSSATRQVQVPTNLAPVKSP